MRFHFSFWSSDGEHHIHWVGDLAHVQSTWRELGIEEGLCHVRDPQTRCVGDFQIHELLLLDTEAQLSDRLLERVDDSAWATDRTDTSFPPS